ncbi:MAG TPA: hypothetical protein DHW42_07435, partial [Candidatus Marinimicrobia bacterium]|nr:hypothetical protein [Candidatus Neomarinimicrobiota bacterium]
KDIKVSAYVDRNTINPDDVITFTVKIDGSSDFSDVPPPESDGFVVIAGPSQSSSIQIINGEITASKTIQWQLVPTRSGKLEIKPITIKFRRKSYQTPAIYVTVNDRQKSSKSSLPGNVPAPQTASPRPQQDSKNNVFLKTRVSKKSLYKGEELIVNFDLYYQNVRTYATQTLPDAKGFWTEQFPENRNPPVETVVVDGIAYKKATIRRLALFPTTTGELLIDPLVINCEIVVPKQRRRSVFDDFFDDSFFSDPFFSNTKVVEVRSDPVTINVIDLPAQGKPEGFSGGVGSFSIESSIDTLQTKQDQALTLRYKISGSGNINGIKLPPPELPANVEAFEPKIERLINNKGKSIRGSVSYEYVIIPRSSGQLRIPALTLHFFDPNLKRYQSKSAPGFNVSVQPYEQSSIARGAGFRKEEISLLGTDIRFIMRESPNWQKIGSTVFNQFWFWLVNVMSLSIISASLVFRWWVDKLENNSLFARRRRALSKAMVSLKALESEIAAGKIETVCDRLDRLLTGFIADKIGLPASGIGPREISAALSDKKTDPAIIKSVETVLKELEQHRFLPGEPEERKFRKLTGTVNDLVIQLSKVL